MLSAQSFIVQANDNDTVGIQAALDQARAEGGTPVLIPARSAPYVITQPLTWHTTTNYAAGLTLIGEGRAATVFDNCVADGPMLDVASTVLLTFQHGGTLQDFTIRSTTRPPASDGVSLRAVYQARIANVQIRDLTGDGIRVKVDAGDPDGCVYLLFDRVWIEDNDGIGIDVEASGVAVENSWTVLRDCFLQYNRQGGMRWRGIQAEFANVAFEGNGAGDGATFGGLQLQMLTGNNRLVRLDGCDFGHNGVCHLDIQSCVNLDARLCEFTHQTPFGFPITHGVKIGGTGFPGAVVQHVTFAKSHVRNTTPGYIQFAVGADALYTTIEDTRWDQWDDETQTRIADSGFLTRVRDDGVDWPMAPAAVNTVLAAPGTYTPDLTRYTLHRVALAVPGAYVIATPASGGQGGTIGRSFLLDLVNTSGGAVTVTFAAGYRTAGFTPPSDGAHRVAWFYKDVTAQWQQIGAW